MTLVLLDTLGTSSLSPAAAAAAAGDDGSVVGQFVLPQRALLGHWGRRLRGKIRSQPPERREKGPKGARKKLVHVQLALA